MSFLRRLFPVPAPAPALDLDALVQGLRDVADDIEARRQDVLDWLYDGELLDENVLTSYRERLDALAADDEADHAA